MNQVVSIELSLLIFTFQTSKVHSEPSVEHSGNSFDSVFPGKFGRVRDGCGVHAVAGHRSQPIMARLASACGIGLVPSHIADGLGISQ